MLFLGVESSFSFREMEESTQKPFNSPEPGTDGEQGWGEKGERWPLAWGCPPTLKSEVERCRWHLKNWMSRTGLFGAEAQG